MFHFVPRGLAGRAPRQARQRAGGRAALPLRGGEEGRPDPRGPRQRRRGDRRPGRAEDARQAGRLADRRRRDRPPGQQRRAEDQPRPGPRPGAAHRHAGGKPQRPQPVPADGRARGPHRAAAGPPQGPDRRRAAERASTARCFRLPDLPGAWADARNDGLYNPVTGEERPVTFDHDAAADRTDVVLLHLGHRLVQMCLRLLRAELWAGATATGERQQLQPGHRPGRARRPAPRARRARRTSGSWSPAPKAPGCTRRSSSPAAPSKAASWSAPPRTTSRHWLAAASDELPPRARPRRGSPSCGPR